MVKSSFGQIRKVARGFYLGCKHIASSISRKAGLIKNKVMPDQYSYNASKRNKKIGHVVYKVKKFHLNHKNLIFLALSFLFTYLILQFDPFYSLVLKLGDFGYVSALIIGFLFSFGFMAIPGAALFYLLGNHLNPLLMATVGAFGAMISNFLIYYFVRYRAMEGVRYTFTNELRLEFSRFEFAIKKKMLTSWIFRDSIPALTGLMLALPIPTEMIVSILWNMTKLETRNVFLFSYIFNFIGILFLGLL
jgi:hypothetical protein